MRLVPLGGISGVPLDFSASENLPNNYTSANADLSSFSQYTLGAMLLAGPSMPVDTTASVPNWGVCELLYVRHTAAAIAPGRLVTIDKDFTIADLANTAGLGRPVYVALTNFSAGTTIPQAGWVLRAGICPVQYAVAATTGLVYIGGAGQATPAQANGKQINNAVCLIAASGSFTRSVRTVNGSLAVEIAQVGGVFVGQAISGTGIPGSTTVAKIAPDGRSVIMSAAATASGQVTGTFTHTGFGICQLDRAFAQGQVV